jgi:chemotaxis protein MotA
LFIKIKKFTGKYMDLSSVIGNVLVWVLIVSAMAMGVGVGAYLDMPSTLIVIGGSLGAVAIAYRGGDVGKLMSVFMISIKPTPVDYPAIIQAIVNYDIQARRDGILSLEGSVTNEENIFLQKGLMMVVDGVEPDIVRTMLETEMEGADSRHKIGIDMFNDWGGFAGAYGLIGTLVGLVAMLVNMSDPSAIGPAMAVALLTTMYGAMIANMITGPVSKILNIRNNEELLNMTLILEGVSAIQAGDNPRIVEQKLMAYIPENQRESQFD